MRHRAGAEVAQDELEKGREREAPRAPGAVADPEHQELHGRIGRDARLAAEAALHLPRLADAGVRLCVLTNKNERITMALLAHFALADYFDFVLPGGPSAPRKPRSAG